MGTNGTFLQIVLCAGLCYGLLVSPDAAVSEDTLHRLQVLEQDNNLLRQQLSQLTHTVQSLVNNVDTLSSEDQNIAFFAYLNNDLVNPANGVTVAFDEVVTNEGHSYGDSHGIFQAPINGSYYFNLVASSPPNSDPTHEMHLFIVNDAHRTSYCYLDHSTSNIWNKCTSNSLLHLLEGSRVWVEVQNVRGNHVLAGHRHADDATHTHFSGFLIHADTPMDE